MNASPQEIARTIGIDAPRPAEVYPDIAVMLRQRDELVIVRIGDVHQDKLRIEIPGEQGAHIPRGNAAERHPVVACIIPGVNLEREIVFNGKFHAARPAPIAEAEARRFVNFRCIARQHSVECLRRLVIAAFNPIERAVIGVLRFHGNGERRVFGENRLHATLQRTEVGDINACLGVDSTRVDLSIAKRRPRQIVEEKIEARCIGRTRPTEIVGLDVVQIGDIVEDAVTFAWASESLYLILGGGESMGSEFIEPIDMLGDDAHGFAVAGELCCLPCVTDAIKPFGDILRRVHQVPHRFGRGTCRVEISGDVVTEQVLQNIRAIFYPVVLAAHVFMCINETDSLNVMRQISHDKILLFRF